MSKMNRLKNTSTCNFALIFFLILNVTCERAFLAQFFINKCVFDTALLFPGTNPIPPWPYVVISMCHIKTPLYEKFLNESAAPTVVPIAHFSPSHGFLLHFSEIVVQEQAWNFERIYEALLISSKQYESFRYKAERYKNRPFAHYDPMAFKKEFLRARWNIDEISLHRSLGAYIYLKYQEDQLPLSIESSSETAERFRQNNLTDWFRLGRKLLHTIQSGYRQQCTHYGILDKLGSLTYNFNAYDRIFCDAFERFGFEHGRFDSHYNPTDLYWLRGRLIRDDLLSIFPPDYSNVVYYASPKLTFVVLQRKPEASWLFASRPFQRSLWIALVVGFGFLEFSRFFRFLLDKIYDFHIGKKVQRKNLFAIILTEDPQKLQEISERYLHCLDGIGSLMRIPICAGYSGMILFCILYPTYPWVPTTFKELNRTKNYFVASAISSPSLMISHLNYSSVLNGLRPEMILNRIKQVPSNYFMDSEKMKQDGSEKEDVFYATVMYDDKMDLWMKGRFFLWQTHPFLNRIKTLPTEDRILPEIRYISVAPGATRMHFLLEAIRRAFTAGTWIRWYYLEQNYYKNVAPLIAERMRRENGLEPTRDENERRPLNLNDLFSVFALEGAGLFLALLVNVFEYCIK